MAVGGEVGMDRCAFGQRFAGDAELERPCGRLRVQTLMPLDPQPAALGRRNRLDADVGAAGQQRWRRLGVESPNAIAQGHVNAPVGGQGKVEQSPGAEGAARLGVLVDHAAFFGVNGEELDARVATDPESPAGLVQQGQDLARRCCLAMACGWDRQVAVAGQVEPGQAGGRRADPQGARWTFRQGGDEAFAGCSRLNTHAGGAHVVPIEALQSGLCAYPQVTAGILQQGGHRCLHQPAVRRNRPKHDVAFGRGPMHGRPDQPKGQQDAAKAARHDVQPPPPRSRSSSKALSCAGLA